VSTLVTRYGRLPPPSRPITKDGVRVERMKARMLDDLSAPLTLSDLADTVGLSTFHAVRIFTREVGIAPHAWRNQMRLLNARSALLGGTPATEVAAANGFTDQSHFNRHFKKANGISPARWSKAR
jgi:AraC-like DNA-binding protein